MKVFYHGDSDGKAAGYLVRKSFQNKEIDFRVINYRDTFPLRDIDKDETVFIVDFSISPEEMRLLLSITPNVVWIDHHKTAIEKYAGFGQRIEGLRIDGIAGCMLTYLYLFHDIYQEDYYNGEFLKEYLDECIAEAPKFIQLIADWDVWTFEYGDNTRHFQVAFNAYDFNPESSLWEQLDPNVPYRNSQELYYINRGSQMIAYRDGWAKSYLESFGYETHINGLPAFAVNLSHCNSEYFKSVWGKYSIYIAYVHDGNQYSVSLYSDKIDTSEISKSFGGGGHKGASGFTCNLLPFIRVTRNDIS